MPKNNVEALVQQFQQSDQISLRDFDKFAVTGSDRAKLLEFRAERPLFIPPQSSLDVAIVAHEQFSTDGTDNNQETFNLSNDVIEGPPTSPNVVCWEDGNRIRPDSVDYSNNTIDVTDSGSNSTLDVYYIHSEQAGVEVEKVSPNDRASQLITRGNSGLLNRTKQHKQPLKVGFDTPFEPFIPPKFRIRVYLDTGGDYNVRWEGSSGTNSGAYANNALFTVPIMRGPSEVDGLREAVLEDITRNG